MSITVRRAIASDIPWLLGQLHEFDVFFGSSRSLYPDPETAEAIVSGLVAEHPFYIAENEREPIGFIAGAVHAHPFNPSLRVLSEMFWWVAQPFRGSRAGHLLLREFIAFGKANADWIVMTLEHESPVNPETLTRRGFRPKETSYLLESA